MVILVFLLQGATPVFCLPARHAKRTVRPSPSLTFLEKDGTCVEGLIRKIDPKTVTVQPEQKPAVVLRRGDLLQVSQAGSLVFSARSSWADVEGVHLLPRESFQLKLRDGKVVKGRPFRVEDQGVVFKIGFWRKKRYAKDRIVTVDYLRVKPNSDAFDYFTQEAPALLFFYPEFYDRLAGMEGEVPVCLYDALQPESSVLLTCSRP